MGPDCVFSVIPSKEDADEQLSCTVIPKYKTSCTRPWQKINVDIPKAARFTHPVAVYEDAKLAALALDRACSPHLPSNGNHGEGIIGLGTAAEIASKTNYSFSLGG